MLGFRLKETVFKSDYKVALKIDKQFSRISLHRCRYFYKHEGRVYNSKFAHVEISSKIRVTKGNLIGNGSEINV